MASLENLSAPTDRSSAASQPLSAPADDSIAVPNLVPVVLEARSGAPEAPAVRIFLGTQPEQYRAERIFVYSLLKVRNPERRYEVYRMTGLAGFERKGWRTGFTNYRFAIPYLAGCQGRAIYTDVDQIFTADPAELFDAPMGEHGYLALMPQDTAVMLIDCERMARCWTYTKACRNTKKSLCAEAAAEPGRFGELDPRWHARDLEYRHGESKLLHYTALNLQPWRPTPDQYSYHINPYAEYFLSLELSANAEGYEIYTAAAPTPEFAPACARLAEAAPVSPAEVCVQARELGAASLALVGNWSAAEAASVPHWQPEQLRGTDLPAQDAVAASGLERLPPEDLPWLVDRLFQLGRQWVLVSAELGPEGSSIGSLGGWQALLRRVAERYPDRCWQLDCRDREGQMHRYRADFVQRTKGGSELPKVWLLYGQHAGDNAQLANLAEALGWPYEVKQPGTRLAELSAPWPDLVFSAGYRTVALAQKIKQRSAGRTRLVAVGRPRTALSRFDLVITTPQYGLPLRDNVVDLPAPVIVERPLDAGQLQVWKQRFADLPRPWVAVLAGGDSAPYRFDVATATSLGREASAALKASGGSLLVSTSPRTSEAAGDALLAAIDVPLRSYRFGNGDENPHQALLALADAFIVTGESVSMLTEACLTGRPVALFPLPARRHWTARLHHRVEQKLSVIDRIAGSRGVPRQQTWLGRFYDRLVEMGLIRPARRVEEVHLALGVAPLSEGLERLPELPPEMLASARARAVLAIRAIMESAPATS